jgi:hypothetical protein
MVALLVVLVVGAGCTKSNPEPDRSSSPPPTTTASAPASAPTTTANAATVGAGAAVAWDAPASWTSMPNSNAMRLATYKIPRASGDSADAELTVSAASGGADANIKRWAGQFVGDAAPKTEKRTVHGLDVTVVEIKGTYKADAMLGGPGTPKDNYMLLAAVVDGDPRQHFFKMTGPEKTVTGARKDFDALLSSLRPK